MFYNQPDFKSEKTTILTMKYFSEKKFFQLFIVLLTLLTSSVNAFDYLQPLPEKIPDSKNNPVTDAKVKLGKMLFFDPRLSLDGTLSCNNCHNILAGGEDGRAFSIGFQGKKTRRSAQSLWNVAFKTVLFWDGHAKSLEAQTMEHLLDKTITGFTKETDLIKRIQDISGYQKEFISAFKEPATINLKLVAQAISSFERTLTTPNSRFDRYIRGEKLLLNEQEIRGMEQFRLQGCIACHFGVNFSGPAPGPALKMGDGFYEIFPNFRGSKYDKPYELLTDKGIYYLTKNPRDEYLWRVPSLRNIALTAPYFHNGRAKTLPEAILIMGKTQYNYDLTDKQVVDIHAFLKTLTGITPVITLPRLPATSGKSVFD